jgi:hypothetical protein
VVALVESNTSSPTEEQNLFFGLVLFCAGKKTSRRNANVEEGSIIRAPVESGRSKVLTYTGEVVLEECFDFSTAGRSTYIESAAISVINSIDKVGRSNLGLFVNTLHRLCQDSPYHVKVQVGTDLGCFARR